VGVRGPALCPEQGGLFGALRLAEDVSGNTKLSSCRIPKPGVDIDSTPQPESVYLMPHLDRGVQYARGDHLTAIDSA